MLRTVMALAFGVALLCITGCDKKDHDEEKTVKEKPKEKSKAQKDAKEIKAPTKPLVTGNWEGRWESTKHPGHGGGLKCVAAESTKDEWTATFTAEFGRTKDYKIELKGKLDGEKVAFGGEVNIGKDKGEGVFKWTGHASEKEFTGDYDGGGDVGTFKMSRPAAK